MSKQNKPSKSKSTIAPPSLNGQWAIVPGRLESLKAKFETAKASSLSDIRDDGKSSPPVTKNNGIAYIPVVGVLVKYPTGFDRYFGLVATEPLRAALANAVEDASVDAIVLYIDSPGGMVAGTTEFAEAISAADTKKPVYAIVSDTCASGGYMIAAQCRSIVANPTAEIGSIGVYQVWADESKFWEDIGIKFTVVSSGGVKGLGADGKVTQDLLDDAQRGVNAIYEYFISSVASGRGMSDAQVRSLADGRCHLAEQARQLGLIDTVASRDAALQAIYLEVTQMTLDSFNAYAAEHPEAVAGFIDKGKQQGLAQGRQETIDSLKSNVEASGGNHEVAVNATVAGQSADAVRLTMATANKLAADAKAKADADAAALASMQKEMDKLRAQIGTQAPLAGGAPVPAAPVDAPKAKTEKDFESIKDPKERAKAEWSDNVANCQADFVSEAAYCGFRTAQLKGSVSMFRAALA